MTQEQIDKLKELKELLDAGILTEEEMKAEKAKILGSKEYQPNTDSAQNSDATSKETNHIKSQDVNSSSLNGDLSSDENNDTAVKEEIKDSTIFKVLGGLVLLMVVVIIIVISTGKKTEEPMSENAELDTISAEQTNIDMSTDYATNNESSDDEFAFDPWVGGFGVYGGMYRLADSEASLFFTKVSKDNYKGTITIALGSKNDDLTFDAYHGFLKGTIRAKASGNVLTVVMDTYTDEKKNDGDNYFKDSHLTGQIFRIMYNNGSYSITPIGEMEDYFDGSAETTITKN